jgi:hypothetical protein
MEIYIYIYIYLSCEIPWGGCQYGTFWLEGDITLPPFEIFSSLDSLNRSARRDLSIGAIFSRFWEKYGKLFWKNMIFSTWWYWNYPPSFDFGGTYRCFRIVWSTILKCFCWGYDPKSSENMFLGEINTKLNFYGTKFKILPIRSGILKNYFFQNISPLFHFCSLKIAPIDRSRNSDRFRLFKHEKISK